MSTITGHYHVKTNTGGYLNDNEVFCVNTPGLASQTVIREINALAGIVSEGCDRDGCRICGWCRAYRRIKREPAVPKVAGSLLRIDTALDGATARVFDVPAGPDLIVWMEQLESNRAGCLWALDA